MSNNGQQRSDNVTIVNAMTVDVEDYFHVAALSGAIDKADWPDMELRVEDNTHRLLNIFDDAEIKATFFVLGWVADKCPALVREIVARGHELACHGYSHQLIYEQRPEDFREETLRAKTTLEDIAGIAVSGYRAASYSITTKSLWALDIIANAGFDYDSSVVPARHDLYGIPGAKPVPYRFNLADGGSLAEFPPSTIDILGQSVPVGGGGYFRIFPYWFSRWGMERINRERLSPFSFYLHPWEIDPDQPRIRTNWKSTFRHYHNLEKFEPRLKTLLGEFRFSTMHNALSKLELDAVDVGSLSVGERAAAS